MRNRWLFSWTLWLSWWCLSGCGAPVRAAMEAPGAPSIAMSPDDAAPPMPMAETGSAVAPEPAPQPPSSALGAPSQPQGPGTPGSAAQGSAVQGSPTRGSGAPAASAIRPAPLLIYQATVVMAVFRAREGLDAVEKLATALGGYLLSRNDTSITIRVPAEHFNQALEQVAQTGDELNRNVSAQDVTNQFNDLLVRLKNAEAVRERLEALLSKASDVKEALAVEQQLERVALNIESLKGQLKRLRELIAFSTITVRFQARPVEKLGPAVRLPFPWLRELGLRRLLEM